MDSEYTLSFWQPNVARILAADSPTVARRPGALAFSMKWLEIESDGTPCAIGRLDQTAADGSNPYPREMGIGQGYNPDDFRAQGVDPAAFRAYCQPPSEMQQLLQEYSAAHARGDTATMHQVMVKAQTRTRELTSDEVDSQVRHTLTNKISAGVAKADEVVARYGLQGWGGVDQWKLAKCDHALPRILNDGDYGLGGMHAVVDKLGRAPRDWAEFRSVLGMDGDLAWKSALDACEECGDATEPQGVA